VDTGKKKQAPKAEESPVDRLVASFAQVGVTSKQLEQKLGHKLADTSGQEFDRLRGLWDAIRKGELRAVDEFPAREPGMDDDIPPGEQIPLEPGGGG